MTIVELVRQLDQHGVSLALTPEGKIRPMGDQPPPAELIAAIRANRVELVRHLERLEGRGAAVPEQGGAQVAAPTVTAPRLAPLPEALVRLIRAAVGNHLNFPAPLPGGLVSNLGEYVLATAAMYAAGVEPERQIQALWEARGAWAA